MVEMRFIIAEGMQALWEASKRIGI